MVLATVKGDVHDIGKNLVDIILTNNGYRVVNLGIKQPADSIITAAQQHKAHAIGLSGLLVKSTLEMKYVIQDLQRQELDFPVICGGAALTRKYVEDDLRREYSNCGFLCRRCLYRPAFDGRSDHQNGAREKRVAGRPDGERVRQDSGDVPVVRLPPARSGRRWCNAPPNIPVPPFYGVRVRKDFDLHEVFTYINTRHCLKISGS